jgi:TM2 domain-containing membrane protein YozV
MSRYYMADGANQRGPFELTDLPGQGLRADTLVWKEGMEQWRRADEVEELIFAGMLGAVPPGLPMAAPTAPQPWGTPGVPVATPYNPAASTSSNRVLAGVLGIVLGTFGVHKFVLGMVGPGIIMLLIGLVGGILTCGVASIVTQVIGIIEGIIYLTRSDQQFYEEYVVRKKGWF